MLADRQTALQAQFAALEATLSQNQSQSSWLDEPDQLAAAGAARVAAPARASRSSLNLRRDRPIIGKKR